MGNRVTPKVMATQVERDFFGGSIRLHILHHAASGEVFGQGLIDELQHHGYRLSPGTLYPILHALERGGYLRFLAIRDGRDPSISETGGRKC
jgi:DNA-binding PadR family transcriptional regulator